MQQQHMLEWTHLCGGACSQAAAGSEQLGLKGLAQQPQERGGFLRRERLVNLDVVALAMACGT